MSFRYECMKNIDSAQTYRTPTTSVCKKVFIICTFPLGIRC